MQKIENITEPYTPQRVIVPDMSEEGKSDEDQIWEELLKKHREGGVTLKKGRYTTQLLNKGYSLDEIRAFAAEGFQKLIDDGFPRKDLADCIYDKFGFNFAYDAESEDNKE